MAGHCLSVLLLSAKGEKGTQSASLSQTPNWHNIPQSLPPHGKAWMEKELPVRPAMATGYTHIIYSSLPF